MAEPETQTQTTEPDTQMIVMNDLSGVEVIQSQPTIRMSEIIAQQSVYLQQEAADRNKFMPLLYPDLEDIRAKLVGWAARNFQGFCDLVVIDIATPNICSDGMQRTFFDYIQFVSGKTVAEHMKTLEPILPDFQVAYSYTRTQLRVGVVLKT